MVTLVQNYFTQSAGRFPSKAAINCADRSIAFGESERFTNAVANHLRDNDLPRQSYVPFFMKKSINAIHSLLSILKCDCAYVPIDVNSPRNRIQAILTTCGASLVIVDAESKAIFENLVPTDMRPQLFVIDEFLAGDTSPPIYRNLSIDVAYVLFTSGSTGVPKGVMIPHKAIIDYIDWCTEEYALTDKDIIANHAPLYFDNSTFDIFTAFSSGAELHLVDDGVNAVIPSLIKWIGARSITTFFCVPSVLTLLLRSRRLKEDSFACLRHVICAGEVLPPDVLRTWMEMYPHIQFTNMYGPTEITVDCSFHVFSEPPGPGELSVPIGKARPNMELFVQGSDGHLSQEAGSRGELLVRGTSVAYGYLGDEEKTQSAFIQNPENDIFADPLYRTGDLVEIDNDGNFVFLGRADDQIKFLGYRIELGEIEAALVAINGVDEAVVVFNNAPELTDQAIGALLGSTDELDLIDIRKALQDRLPAYMIPTVIELANSGFPRTPNGKYARRLIRERLFGLKQTEQRD